MIDGTFVREQVQDLTIACWTIIEEEQLTKITLGTEKSVQHVKVNASLELIRCHRTND